MVIELIAEVCTNKHGKRAYCRSMSILLILNVFNRYKASYYLKLIRCFDFENG